MTNSMHTNRLIEATSPYLLQHAHNPVDWYPWGQEALAKAKNEQKPIIVSIGYSACHWCHVMERESFEDADIASIMNEHFVCIKVDREERPDVDQVYMEALHTMGLQGGWPLNVFLMPDQRPFYGGTYFPPQGWARLLHQIARAFREQHDELAKSADGFLRSLSTNEIEKYGLVASSTAHTKAELHEAFKQLAPGFDRKKGGMNRAPKFPMPVIYDFLLREYKANDNTAALDQTLLTLDQMAMGGLYDQIGGGFTRYSTDSDWFVPHFEKMLYDNGQLVSLYSEAYQLTKKPLYKQTVFQTIDWLEREMLHEEGGFYAALDADSEGEEGKFYLWTLWEFQQVLGPDAEVLIDYYNITKGNWERGKNIPFCNKTDEAFATKHGLVPDEWQDLLQSAQVRLLHERATRVRPGLDDKILAGWNGLMCHGLAQAYAAFGEEKFLRLALRNMEFLLDKMTGGDRLFRNYKNGKASISAYLEDYAAVVQALISLYQASLDEHWLFKAQSFTDYVIANFSDEEGFFYFTDRQAEKLIARKKEIFDNVIPSSNSLMAKNLYLLGTLLDRQDYLMLSNNMLSRVKKHLPTAPRDLAHWAGLLSMYTYPTAEIVVVSKRPEEALKALNKHYIPNKVIAGKRPEYESKIPLLEGRILMNDQTTYYLCYHKTCQLPVNSVDELLEQLNNK